MIDIFAVIFFAIPTLSNTYEPVADVLCYNNFSDCWECWMFFISFARLTLCTYCEYCNKTDTTWR